jgi:hypothetical protein
MIPPSNKIPMRSNELLIHINQLDPISRKSFSVSPLTFLGHIYVSSNLVSLKKKKKKKKPKTQTHKNFN